ncbi:VOC family protein [Sphingobacterium sp. LRF_L2]|uniref:VOC family protein n=1 Tax=Sphingobacterium sp. LRF_L2 TaxID=3369421 RepID=UPI003F643246
MEISFDAGINIAMKIPLEKYRETVAFYRDILLFDVEEIPITHPTVLATHRLTFGQNILWLDCVKELTSSKIWFEILTKNIMETTNYLHTNEVRFCDEIEAIDQSKMHWIKDPCDNVILVKNKE